MLQAHSERCALARAVWHPRARQGASLFRCDAGGDSGRVRRSFPLTFVPERVAVDYPGAGRAGRAKSRQVADSEPIWRSNAVADQLDAPRRLWRHCRAGADCARQSCLPPSALFALNLRAEANNASIANEFLESACNPGENLSDQLAEPQLDMLGTSPRPWKGRPTLNRAHAGTWPVPRSALHQLACTSLAAAAGKPIRSAQGARSIDVDPLDMF